MIDGLVWDILAVHLGCTIYSTGEIVAYSRVASLRRSMSTEIHHISVHARSWQSVFYQSLHYPPYTFTQYLNKMAGSQLTQLKSALTNAGLGRKSFSKKEKKAFKKGGARETDRAKTLQKLEDIKRGLNKFDHTETRVS
jgi:hypothetical protein